MGDETSERNGTITFRGGTGYWSYADHTILASYIRGIARKRWNLIGESKRDDIDFKVPRRAECRQSYGLYCQVEHRVPEEAVYVHATDVLGMKPNIQIVEKIIEKIVIEQRGYITTIEKHEALAFALTRELRLTQYEVERCYKEADTDGSLRFAQRVRIIREVMDDLGVPEIEPPTKTPTWFMPTYEVEEEEPQMSMELVPA